MREIKFRVWSTKLKAVMIPLTFGTLEDLKAEKDWIVMQFTGLKDKNGKEIYEGDILKSGNNNYEVYWDKDDAHFSPLSEFISNKRSEVIGNIYENEDLLIGWVCAK